jgi:hypothetical protein
LTNGVFSPNSFQGSKGRQRQTVSQLLFVFVFVAGGRQVYIELVVEALLIILSYVDVTSDSNTMPVQVVAGR